MSWHDRIANDRALEGWSVSFTYREGQGVLEVASRRYWPDGREYDSEWTSYEALTTAEARDVALATVDSIWTHQPCLPGFEGV